jgi:hypothetical protein
MKPETRFATTLLASLVLWSPTLLAVLHGSVALPDAAIWYLLALVVSYLAIGGFNALLLSYHRQNATAQAQRDTEALAERLAQLDRERASQATEPTAPPEQQPTAAE